MRLLAAMVVLAIVVTPSHPAAAKIDHPPIYITSDSGFASCGFPGAGTQDDPYRIEGLRITTDALRRNGVEIRNTRAHFIVRCCEINAAYIGVLVEDVAPGTATITGNVVKAVSHQGGGIVLGSDRVKVNNNTCTGFIEGLHTNYADDCAITYNNFSYNVYHGISLRYSNDNLVAHNTIQGNGAHGVFIIRDSTGNRVLNNTFRGNSQMESYEWDDAYSFTVGSQGLDEGRGNHWSDEETSIGNRWSDYNGVGEYRIDGSANAVDRYPVRATSSPATPVEPPIEPGGGIPGFGAHMVSLGVAVITLVFWFSRKRGDHEAR